jgi:DNA-binding MarR family transcriptional regulator
MPNHLKDKSLSPKAFMSLQRTRDLLFRCEDQVVAEFGITAEQYSVLMAMQDLDEPVRATDIARWLGHKVNSVSMLVDRMVKASLVERERDLPDRRAVRLSMTSKGEQAYRRATPAVSRLVEDLLSPLSHKDKDTLISLMEALRGQALQHLNSRN